MRKGLGELVGSGGLGPVLDLDLGLDLGNLNERGMNRTLVEADDVMRPDDESTPMRAWRRASCEFRTMHKTHKKREYVVLLVRIRIERTKKLLQGTCRRLACPKLLSCQRKSGSK